MKSQLVTIIFNNKKNMIFKNNEKVLIMVAITQQTELDLMLSMTTCNNSHDNIYYNDQSSL